MPISVDPLLELRRKFERLYDEDPSYQILSWYATDLSTVNDCGDKSSTSCYSYLIAKKDRLQRFKQCCLEALIQTGELLDWRTQTVESDPIKKWIYRIFRIQPKVADLLAACTTVSFSEDGLPENQFSLSTDESLLVKILDEHYTLEDGLYTVSFKEDLRLVSAMAIDVAIGIRDKWPTPIQAADLPSANRPVRSIQTMAKEDRPLEAERCHEPIADSGPSEPETLEPENSNTSDAAFPDTTSTVLENCTNEMEATTSSITSTFSSNSSMPSDEPNAAESPSGSLTATLTRLVEDWRGSDQDISADILETMIDGETKAERVVVANVAAWTENPPAPKDRRINTAFSRTNDLLEEAGIPFWLKRKNGDVTKSFAARPKKRRAIK